MFKAGAGTQFFYTIDAVRNKNQAPAPQVTRLSHIVRHNRHSREGGNPSVSSARSASREGGDSSLEKLDSRLRGNDVF